MATGAHITKAGTRVIINASPEPVSNWTASITEDIAVIGGLWAALYHPWVFLGLLILFIITMAWAIPRIWRGIKGIFEVIVNFFKRKKPDSSKQIEQKNINNG